MKLAGTSVAIIGAGFGGLAAANLLAQAGATVTIFERHSASGGRAGTLKEHGFRFDTGPSWYLMPEAFEHFFWLLGENREDYYKLVRLDPAYTVFFEHTAPFTITGRIEHDVTVFESIEKNGSTALVRYLGEAKEAYELARQYFLYNNFSNWRSLMHYDLVKSAVRLSSALGQPLHRYVSGYVATRELQQILEYPMVFLGASPFEAPSMYRLMSHMDFNQGVFYPEHGMYSLVEALEAMARSRGVSIHYNAEVKHLTAKDGRVTSLQLHSQTTEPYDIVISNADLHFTETKLLDQPYQSYPETYWRKRRAAPSALLMYLGVKGSLPSLTHHNLFFSEQWQQNFDDIFVHKRWPQPASMYVCKTSATDSTVAPKGHENLFVLVPGPASGQTTSTEELAERYLKQLSKLPGLKDLASRIVYKRVYGPEDFETDFNAWQGSMLGMAHTLKQSAFFRPSNKSRKLNNLYYVGANTVPGVGLPMCLISAEALYKRLLGNTTAGPLTTPIKRSVA